MRILVRRRKRYTRLSNRLRLLGLLLVVGLNTRLLQRLGLRVILLVRAKQVDLIVVRLGGRGCSSSAGEGLAGLATAGERGELGLVRLDVLVPARDGRVRRGVRCGAELGEDVDVCLRGRVARSERLVRVYDEHVQSVCQDVCSIGLGERGVLIPSWKHGPYEKSS